ncbi:MAG: GNAT family N-acetyltransferase [Rhodobacteraceae bacterium]|nr:GNAT family N-acetyltransferase [Paracoccaceae bacterium]
MSTIDIHRLDGPGLLARLEALSVLLSDSVAAGAAISFMHPLHAAEARAFWLEAVMPEVVAGRRALLVAEAGGRLAGTVQMIPAPQPNQPHRCDIAKMMVAPAYRRRGIGRALLEAACATALEQGRTLAVLDTRTGDISERFYRAAGFEVAGSVPDYAWDADGRALHATTFLYRRLGPHGGSHRAQGRPPSG